MSDSVIVGLALAVLLCWALGAYKRLLRSRAQAVQAFSALTAWFNQSLSLVSVRLAEQDAAQVPVDDLSGADAASEAWAGWMAASRQFSAALLQAQAQPLEAAELASLSLAWARLRALPAEPTRRILPHDLVLQWVQLCTQTEVARAEFNQRAINYNEAIQQFPAFMLARMMGFKPAQPI